MKKLLLFTLVLVIFAVAGHAQQPPNILLIMADDMGYSDLGSYGGEIQTPRIDQLAQNGLRYRQFYNAARCCPSRAALMTGLYPHQAGMGWMAVADLGTPAYQDNLNNECVTIAEVLRSAGYRTYMTGKWHLTNERKIEGGITDNWPVQRGFNRYFGIIPGGANYFTPFVYSNNERYKAPENFYLTDAISDTSVQYLKDHFAQKNGTPFFLYVAYTAPHWPLHAPQTVISKYREKYRAGWDALRQQRFNRQRQMGVVTKAAALAPRDTAVPAWTSLTPEKQEEMATRMAIYAAQIDIMDQGIGRMVDVLKKNGQLNNTLIMILSDNGACAEFISSGESKAVTGEANTFESYRIHWANLSSTPFKEYKHYTYEGGIATPLIVHWPAGIDKKLNNQFVAEYGHLTDIMATCVDVAGARYPAQYRGHAIHPMEGKSLQPHFTGHTNNRGPVFWEHEANIALRNGPWKLVAKTPENTEFNKQSLRLYNMEADPSEMHDLSREQPALVKEYYDAWLAWAKKIGAFPLDTRPYGERLQVYRRNVNGTFDDNLGGWNVRKNDGVQGTIIIDTLSPLSGKKSVLASVVQPGERPAAMAMFWPFRVTKGETFTLELKTRSNQPARFMLRLEKADGAFEKIIDEEITAETGMKEVKFRSTAAAGNGQYRIGLYFGKMAKGSKVWVDDVRLVRN
ncbi:arylsulfatase [Chitinophaga alhagiae]|uniref:arylsulfatase n=1 Tax=Chitinophaga alhagiae TaxID=2203219 RepID=UPI000E5B57B5|nr:arylsulfatase [Chitinophaga alhagiae]